MANSEIQREGYANFLKENIKMKTKTKMKEERISRVVNSMVKSPEDTLA